MQNEQLFAILQKSKIQLYNFWQENQIIHNERLLQAFLQVKREQFVRDYGCACWRTLFL